jgi:hypothetical protein
MVLPLNRLFCIRSDVSAVLHYGALNWCGGAPIRTELPSPGAIARHLPSQRRVLKQAAHYNDIVNEHGRFTRSIVIEPVKCGVQIVVHRG